MKNQPYYSNNTETLILFINHELKYLFILYYWIDSTYANNLRVICYLFYLQISPGLYWFTVSKTNINHTFIFSIFCIVHFSASSPIKQEFVKSEVLYICKYNSVGQFDSTMYICYISRNAFLLWCYSVNSYSRLNHSSQASV